MGLLDDIRTYLGQHTLILKKITALEELMARATDQLNALSAKFDDLMADVRALRDALVAERDTLTDESQAALDTLSAKVDAFDAEVGDADGSDTPPVEEPANPEQPTA